MGDKKTKEEIEIMREGGALLSNTLRKIREMIKDGVVVRDVDKEAERLLIEGGGKPSFKGYNYRGVKQPFPSTVCISLNDEVVHGFGHREMEFKNGDVVGLDIGVEYKGFFTDTATTISVGKTSEDNQKLINITKESLLVGLKSVKNGSKVSDIGKAIESYVKKYGYGIVKDLTGHGVGKKIHEDPSIPNYYDKRYDNQLLETGMTIAVEPMLTLGGWQVKTLDDGWTIVTTDGSIAAHFEATVVVTDNGYEILTPII